MGFAHALIAGFMYYGRPKPEEGSIIGIKNNNIDFNIDNIVLPTQESVKNIMSYDNIKELTNYLENYFLHINSIENDIFFVFDTKNNKYSLYKEIYIEEDSNDVFNSFKLILLENNKFLLYSYNYQIFEHDILNQIEYKYYKLRELQWGWTIRYDEKKYESYGDSPILYKTIKENKGKINVWDSCVAFSALTSIFHFSFGYIYPDKYKEWMSNSRNPMRWIEYFVTSGIMMINLASTSGVTDRNDLLSLFAMTAITNIFGMAIEESYGKVTKSIFMISGFISFIIPWFFIFDEYNKIYREFKDNGLLDILQSENPDAYNLLTLLAPVAISVMGILYFLFPAIQINQIFYPSKYRTGELSFILASFISKISLNIFAYYLGNRPSISYIRQSCEFIQDNNTEDNTIIIP